VTTKKAACEFKNIGGAEHDELCLACKNKIATSTLLKFSITILIAAMTIAFFAR